MPTELRTPLPWLLAAASLLILPCILALFLDLQPGTRITDHLPTAISVLITGLALMFSPRQGDTTKVGVPEDHQESLAYGIRTGTLPIASLFSDWRSELANRMTAYSSTLRILPTATAGATALDLYAALIDPTGGLFFLVSAAATLALGLGTYALSALRLTNTRILEDKLSRQIRLLEVTTSRRPGESRG
ncbi:hypothetical protein [Arthrobacter sp. 135MFCol5.1]|uniref:hypothetical protein n=1 Tax=Arthrobacter sp. 135MFCol5.1 TaxID=1158050 RepID=UPI000376A22A|nr:hypothetical protein [Arthrobacter sp. 135MFCol5.1]